LSKHVEEEFGVQPHSQVVLNMNNDFSKHDDYVDVYLVDPVYDTNGGHCKGRRSI
jgi:hypothetical protein